MTTLLPELEEDEGVREVVLGLRPDSKWYLLKEKDVERRLTKDSIGKVILVDNGRELRYLDGSAEGAWNSDKSRVVFRDMEKRVVGREEQVANVGGRQVVVRTLVVVTEQNSGSKDVRYKSFITKMKDTKAMPLVRSIKRFISKIGQEAGENGSENKEFQAELPTRVSTFLDEIFKELQLNPLWVEADNEELTHAREGMEKYVLCKVHPYIFGREEEVYNKDQEIIRRFREYDETPLQALLPPTRLHNHPRWREAIGQLQAVNEYKSPFDKLICVANCCRIVNLISIEQAGGKPEPGVIHEEMLTNSLMYLLQASKTPLLVSNVTYIAQYREQGKMPRSENTTFLACIQKAVSRWLSHTPYSSQVAALLPTFDPAAPVISPALPSASHIPLQAIPTLVEQTFILREMECQLREQVGLPPSSA